MLTVDKKGIEIADRCWNEMLKSIETNSGKGVVAVEIELEVTFMPLDNENHEDYSPFV